VAKIAGIKLCESYNRQYGVDYRSVMPTNLYGPGDNFHAENSHVVPALIRRFHLARLAGQGDIVAINANEARYGRIPDETLSDFGLERVNSDLSLVTSHQVNPLGDQSSGEWRSQSVSPGGPVTVTIWGSGKPFREFLHVDDMAAASLFVLNLPVDQYEANTEPMLSHINVGSGSEVSIRDLAGLIAEVTGFSGEIAFDATKPDGTPRKLMDSSRLANMGWQASIGLKDGLADAYRWFLDSQESVRK